MKPRTQPLPTCDRPTDSSPHPYSASWSQLLHRWLQHCQASHPIAPPAPPTPRFPLAFLMPQAAAQAAAPHTAAIAKQKSAQPVALPTSPDKVLKLLDHFLDWTEDMQPNINATLFPVLVIPVTPKYYPSERQTNFVSTAAAQPQQQAFQVWVKGKLMVMLPEERQAQKLAKRLQEVLQSSDFDPNAIQPKYVKSIPAGKVNSQVLFLITPELAARLGRYDTEQIAIEWVNRLRQALDVRPLSPSEVELKLSNLVETGEYIDGVASWYGPYFHGRLTATGEIFDENVLTAAHPSLPFDTYLRVTNLQNYRSVIVRINDRGPYVEGRNLDLSRAAAQQLDSEEVGIIHYQAAILRPEQRP